MKKLSTLLTAFSLLVSITLCPSVTVGATGDPAIVVSSGSAYAGENVTITVSLRDNPGIQGILIDTHYDQTRLELVSETESGMFSVYGTSANITVHPFNTTWTKNYGTGEVTGDGVLVTFVFKVKDTAAPGFAEIRVDSRGKATNIVNSLFQSVAFDFIPGGVTVLPCTIIIDEDNSQSAGDSFIVYGTLYGAWSRFGFEVTNEDPDGREEEEINSAGYEWSAGEFGGFAGGKFGIRLTGSAFKNLTEFWFHLFAFDGSDYVHDGWTRFEWEK